MGDILRKALVKEKPARVESPQIKKLYFIDKAVNNYTNMRAQEFRKIALARFNKETLADKIRVAPSSDGLDIITI